VDARRSTGELSEKEWRVIAATVTPGIDALQLQIALEEVRRDRRTPKQNEEWLANKLRDYAAFLRVVPDMLDHDLEVRLSQWAAGCMAETRRELEAYSKIARTAQPRLRLKQFEALRAWQRAGGSIEYNTPRRGCPYGAAIDYLIAAAPAIWGRSVSPVRAKQIIIAFKKTFHQAGAQFAGQGGLWVDAKLLWRTPTMVAV
jgi:hypothetical protein